MLTQTLQKNSLNILLHIFEKKRTYSLNFLDLSLKSMYACVNGPMDFCLCGLVLCILCYFCVVSFYVLVYTVCITLIRKKLGHFRESNSFTFFVWMETRSGALKIQRQISIGVWACGKLVLFSSTKLPSKIREMASAKKKRSADSYLTDQNWDQEEETESANDNEVNRILTGMDQCLKLHRMEFALSYYSIWKFSGILCCGYGFFIALYLTFILFLFYPKAQPRFFFC